MREATLKWIVVLILTGFALIAGLNLVVRLLLYHPRAYRAGYEQQLGHDVDELRFRTAAGEQSAFYLPATAAAPSRLWFVFCGNGSVALDWLPVMRVARSPRDAAVLIDYPGYGRSEGRPTVEGARDAADGALNVIADKLGLTSEELAPRLNVVGHSLGAAVALDFAREHRQVERVILLAPFTSLRAEIARFISQPLSRLLFFNFDNRAALRELARRQPCPRVFAFHGDRDGMIPASMSEQLAAEFPGMIDLRILPGTTHDTVVRDARDEMHEIMNRAPAADSSRPPTQ